MLLVVGAEAAVVGTAVVDFGAVGPTEWCQVCCICRMPCRPPRRRKQVPRTVRIAAALAHVNLVIAQKNVSGDDSSALRAMLRVNS